MIQYSGEDTLRQAEWNYGPQIWMMHNLTYAYNQKNRFFDRFKTTIAYQFFEESRIDRRMFSNNLRNRKETVNAISASLDFEKRVNPALDVFYGAEYVYNLVNSIGIVENVNTREENTTSTRYPDGSTWGYGSLYGAVKYRLSPKAILNSGLRLNYVGLQGEIDTSFFPFSFNAFSNDFFAANGSFGISYLPTNTWQLNVNLSNGFRAPNIDDVSKIFDSSPGIVVIPNPELNPEFLYSLDVGIVKTFKRFQFELSGFYSYLDNALVRNDFTLDGADSIFYDGELSQVQALQNAASATVWGIQGGIKFSFKSYQFKTSLHYNQGRTSDDEPLRHVAPLFGSTHFIYAHDKTTIDLYSIYNGAITFNNLAPTEIDKPHIYAIDDNGNPYSPSWVTLNLRLEQKLHEKLSLQIGLENLLDVRYRAYSSGIAAMGRSISLTIRGHI